MSVAIFAQAQLYLLATHQHGYLNLQHVMLRMASPIDCVSRVLLSGRQYQRLYQSRVVSVGQWTMRGTWRWSCFACRRPVGLYARCRG